MPSKLIKMPLLNLANYANVISYRSCTDYFYFTRARHLRDYDYGSILYLIIPI